MAEVGHGVIRISVDDEAALADLRRIQNNFDRAMKNIDGKEAEMKLTADDRDLKRSIKDTNDELKALEQRRKKVKDPAVANQLKLESQVLKTQLRQLKEQAKAQDERLRAQKKHNQELRLTEQRLQ